MDIYDEEILALWESLQNNHVEYIIVGGFAVNLNGFSRFTSDIDIWLKDTLENRKKFRKAISAVGLGDFKEFETMQFIPDWSTIYLGSIELDMMTELVGFEQQKFDTCFANSIEANVHGISIRFLHINQLIEEKKAAARPKDLWDVEELEKIKKIQDEENDLH